MTVYGYLRCSTSEQAQDGYSIESQRTVIAERFPDVEWIEDAGASGSTLERPGLAGLLDVIGRGDSIVVSRLDRLSRSVVDFGTLLQRSQDEHWSLVALDFALDTGTPGGRLIAHILSAVSQWERETIAQRTRDGLAEAKRNGVKLGRASTLSAETRAYIHRLHDGGLTQAQIAEQLNAESVCAAAGGEWSQQQVSRVLRVAVSTRKLGRRSTEFQGRHRTVKQTATPEHRRA
jgi:DNA invertase Pin-like site-specific DNA recombinase